MKKTIRILAMLMVLATIGVFAVGCSKMISGKYSAGALGLETTYEFKGTKVIKTTGVGEFQKVSEGTYKILENENNKDELVIELTFGDNVERYPFSKGEENGNKYIVIGIVKYEKVK